MLRLINGVVVTEEDAFNGYVEIDEGTITRIGKGEGLSHDPVQTIDVGGRYICPGLIDIHIHGAGGYDIMEGGIVALEGVARQMVGLGVTSFLPTLRAGTPEKIRRALETAAELLGGPPSGAEVLGVHLEGPYIC